MAGITIKVRLYNKSYVISVSLGKGCYRHIRISGKATLEDLSDAILEAFDFDNDHLHAFFMNNKAWNDEDCYYSPYAEEDEFRTNSGEYYALSLIPLYSV